MAKHPKGHSCAKNMIWSDQRCRCIQQDLEAVPENPNDRSKAFSPLVFPTHKKRGDIQKI